MKLVVVKLLFAKWLPNFWVKNWITVNAHQNTETGDLLGAQRPVRNKYETQSSLFNHLLELFAKLGIETATATTASLTLDNLLTQYNKITVPEEYKELVDKLKLRKRTCHYCLNGVMVRW